MNTPAWAHDDFLHGYWVEPGAILAGEYPGDLRRERAVRKLELLIDNGVRTIVDLTETVDGLVPYEDLLSAVAAARGVEVVRVSHPIPDVSVTDHAGYDAIVRTVREAVDRGVVYIHCWGGIGRTGTVVGCLLVDDGHTADAALARIDQWRSVTRKAHQPAPQVRSQVAIVRERERFLPTAGALTTGTRYRFTKDVLRAAASTEVFEAFAGMHDEAWRRRIHAHLRGYFGVSADDEDTMAFAAIGGNNMGGGVPPDVLHLLARLSRVDPHGADGSSAEVTVVLGDITAQEVDAIVNAANPQLRDGAGLAGARAPPAPFMLRGGPRSSPNASLATPTASRSARPDGPPPAGCRLAG